MKCRGGCEGNTCSSQDGTCSCRRNYSGEQCENCSTSRYGEDCSKPCSLGCLDNTCFSTDGSCDCTEYYTGAKCDVCVDGRYGDAEQNHLDELDTFQTGALTGGIVGGVVVLMGAVALIVWVKRRLSQKEAQDYENKQETTTHGGNATQPGPYETLNTGRIEKNDRKDTYTNEDDQIARAAAIEFEEKGGIYYNNADKINKQKVAVNSLMKYVIEKTDIVVEEEFEKFPYGLTKSYDDSQKQGHIQRNRYKGIYPSLGPMSKQLGDFSPFWQMIWQEKGEKIVMLTNLVEKGKDKCEQYWPDLGTSKVYGKVHVSSQSEDEYAEFTRREYTISKGSETRQLHHFHFTRWPDNGVPDDVIGIIEFRQRVLNIPGQFDGPVLVHCSQYEFLHRALVCSLSDISKPIRGTHFRQYINQMGREGFNRQFQEMQTILEKPPGYEMQTTARNNRIKGDRNRPYRFLNSPPGASECINAVYIDSLKARTSFLVVQSPMKENVIDFLTLLSQEKCTCVVSFEPYTDKQKKQNVGLYFPAGDHNLKQGMFQVRCAKQENHGYFTKRLLTIKHNEHNEQSSEREVTHFEFNAWDYTSDVPKSSKDFLDFIKSVDANLRETSNRGPLLVHCLHSLNSATNACCPT
ncbi:PTPRM-like protein [Mya arenaria]|uniref:protein-tyrosine-phosphatase n=1 Tax=Mya arenaria TaxID=6604 RepID=A0ABY7F8B1_MYAAR|nr:PTPRM-like protein [Mya arenaria]